VAQFCSTLYERALANWPYGQTALCRLRAWRKTRGFLATHSQSFGCEIFRVSLHNGFIRQTTRNSGGFGKIVIRSQLESVVSPGGHKRIAATRPNSNRESRRIYTSWRSAEGQLHRIVFFLGASGPVITSPMYDLFARVSESCVN